MKRYAQFSSAIGHLLVVSFIAFSGLTISLCSVAQEESIRVLSPRGIAPPVERTPLAPRPNHFDGKRIVLVSPNQSGSRMDEAFDIAQAALEAQFPKATITRKPKVSTYSSDDPDFWDEVMDGADAFVYGAAPSASSTDWAVNWSGLLEKRGLPGVVIHYAALTNRVERSVASKGIPVRAVSMSFPPGEMDLAERSVFSTRLIEGMSKQLAANEQLVGIVEKPQEVAVDRTLKFASVDAAHEFFHAEGWTDGLPIVPPTPKRVARMLEGTSITKDTIVSSSVWPESWTATVEHVAINAVMAGARPEYMPTLLALAEAWGGSRNYSTVQSTNSFAYMVVVNGPVRHELEMNSGTFALGPGNRANATIGRALRLFITNLGGGQPGINMMGTQGNTAMYSLAFAEDEESSPWPSLAEEYGHSASESTVAIMSGGWSKVGNFLDGNLDRLIKGITYWEYPGRLVVLMTPLAAQKYAAEGYSKETLKKYIRENARMRLDEFKQDTYYDWFVLPSLLGKRSLPGLSWPKEYLTLPDDTMVSVFPGHEAINLIVVGGDVNPMMQGWSFATPFFAEVDKWR